MLFPDSEYDPSQEEDGDDQENHDSAAHIQKQLDDLLKASNLGDDKTDNTDSLDLETLALQEQLYDIAGELINRLRGTGGDHPYLLVSVDTLPPGVKHYEKINALLTIMDEQLRSAADHLRITVGSCVAILRFLQDDQRTAGIMDTIISFPEFYHAAIDQTDQVNRLRTLLHPVWTLYRTVMIEYMNDIQKSIDNPNNENQGGTDA